MANGLLLNYSHPWEQPLDIAQWDAIVQHSENKPPETEFQANITAYGKDFIALVGHLVFNTLQLMLSKPELVSMGSLIRQVHSKRHSIKRLLVSQLNRYRLQIEAGAAATGRHAFFTARSLGTWLLA